MKVATEAAKINGKLSQVEAAAEGVKVGRFPELVPGTPESRPVDDGVRSGVVLDSGASGGVNVGVVFDSGAKAGDRTPGTTDELPGAGAGTKVAGPVHMLQNISLLKFGTYK